jgi:hypothetical protein
MEINLILILFFAKHTNKLKRFILYKYKTILLKKQKVNKVMCIIFVDSNDETYVVVALGTIFIVQ